MGTTKYSEQSHVPNHDSKEKEFELKENSKIQSQDLLLLNRFLNRLHVRAGFAAYRRVRLGISLPAHYDRNGLRLRRDTRERYRSPTSLRMFRAGGLLGMFVLVSATVEHPARHLLRTCVSPNRIHIFPHDARSTRAQRGSGYSVCINTFQPGSRALPELGMAAGPPWLLALCPTACPHGTGALMALVASMVVSCIRAPHPTCRTFISTRLTCITGAWDGPGS